jgi:hypothetical protein
MAQLVKHKIIILMNDIAMCRIQRSSIQRPVEDRFGSDIDPAVNPTSETCAYHHRPGSNTLLTYSERLCCKVTICKLVVRWPNRSSLYTVSRINVVWNVELF